jgi:tetratricopeptide (TPR) repeat protein
MLGKSRQAKQLILIQLFLLVLFFPIVLSAQNSTIELNRKAILFFQSEKYDSALVLFNQLIEKNPTDSMAYIDRALTKEKLGDFTGAIADYSRLAKLAPNEVDAYFLRASVLYELGMMEEAIVDFQHSILLENDNAYAYYFIGKILQHQGKKREANSYFEKAIEHNPEHAESFFELAQVQFKKNSLDSALKLVNKSIQFFPKNEAYCLKCLIAYKMNKFDEAVNCFDLLLENNPKGIVELLKETEHLYNKKAIEEFLKLSSTSDYSKLILYVLQGKREKAHSIIQLGNINKIDKVLFMNVLTGI